MKTIKLFFVGLLSLFIAVLSMRYAVISCNYITTDFTTTFAKDILNFGVTFGIQAIILVAISLFFIVNAIACFTNSYSYYMKWKIDYRNRQLLTYNEEEKYNDLCKALTNAKTTKEKEELINDYLNPVKARGNRLHELMEAWLKGKRREEPVTPKEAYKPNSTVTATSSIINFGQDITFDRKGNDNDIDKTVYKD